MHAPAPSHRYLPAVALLCLALGGVAGFAVGAARAPAPTRRAFTPVRESGYRFVNPLLACDSGGDILQDEDLRSFQPKVEAAVAAQLRLPGVEAVSVYFRELNDGIGFSIGDGQGYVAASLRKVPMMIAVLKTAERTPGYLDRPLRFELATDHNAQQTIKPAIAMSPGETYTIRELLRRMIVYSDNNAFMLLGAHVDPGDLDRTYTTLDFRPGHGSTVSAETFASFFRVLYNANYLGKDLSEWALATLAQSDFRGGLVEGVPPEVPVAHKFGESRDEGAGKVQLHDCGLVYDPRHPYVLCVLTRGRSFENLDDAIASVARAVQAEVTAQGDRGQRIR
jgi:beta-lactamase class A